MNIPSALIALSLGLAGPLAQAACKYGTDLDIGLELGGAERVEVHALAGELEISGAKGAEAGRIRGRMCTDDEAFLERMAVRTRREGKVAIVDVVIPRWSSKDLDYAYIDLKIALPPDMPVDVDDTSGDMRLDNVAASHVRDSSGDIVVVKGRHALQIEDSSGDIEIRELTGNLGLSDSSGGIKAKGVQGNVYVETDSSGDLRFSDIRGDVVIESDSSGDIDIEHVTGSVRIGSDSSGDIDVSGVSRDVLVDSDGSGDIEVAGVMGDFTLGQKGEGTVKTRDIKGRIRTPGGRR